jgi:hypothetical protein
VKTRLLQRTDERGTEVVWLGIDRTVSHRGVLLHQWDGFAWVLWDGKRVPETERTCELWVEA